MEKTYNFSEALIFTANWIQNGGKLLFFVDSDQQSHKLWEFADVLENNKLILVVSISNRKINKFHAPWLLNVKTYTQTENAADVLITVMISSLCTKIKDIYLITEDNFAQETAALAKSFNGFCEIFTPKHHLGIWLTLNYASLLETKKYNFVKRFLRQEIYFATEYMLLLEGKINKKYLQAVAYTLAKNKRKWSKPVKILPYVDLRMEFHARYTGNVDDFCKQYNVEKNIFIRWLNKRVMSCTICETKVSNWLLE